MLISKANRNEVYKYLFKGIMCDRFLSIIITIIFGPKIVEIKIP